MRRECRRGGLDGSIRRSEIMQVPTVSLRRGVLRCMKQFSFGVQSLLDDRRSYGGLCTQFKLSTTLLTAIWKVDGFSC